VQILPTIQEAVTLFSFDAIAVRMAADYGLPTITAFTGMRLGSLVGLPWIHTCLDDSCSIEIDNDLGAFHKIHSQLELGPQRPGSSKITSR
jgi:hypothetical protein